MQPQQNRALAPALGCCDLQHSGQEYWGLESKLPINHSIMSEYFIGPIQLMAP